MHLRINLASYPINFSFLTLLLFEKKTSTGTIPVEVLVKVCFGEIGSVIPGKL